MRIETTVGSSTRIEPGHPAGLVLSVLYDTAAGSMSRLRDDPPACFADLYLDQVIAGVVAGREDYHLEPFYYSSLSDVSAICYRHEVFQDLEQPLLFSRVKAFVEQMVTLRHYLAFATKFDYQPERQRWFLDAARLYCAAIAELLTTLQTADLSSRALLALRDHLAVYSGSDPFRSLSTDADRMIDELSEVVYCVEIRGGRVTVMKYEGEPDYSAQVAETFARFRQGAVSEYRTQVMNRVDMNHVEGQIIERVAKLFPDVFGNLEQFCETHQGFVDPTVATFDREIQFYLSYLEFIAPMRSASLEFCYPTMSETSKAECAVDSFDVALAVYSSPSTPKSLPTALCSLDRSGSWW